MTIRLYLVRHGAKDMTMGDRFSGSVDVELSDEGREQAKRLVERLAEDDIAAVFSSLSE
jgi:broad specificity phosphatase PhoE